MKQYTRNRFLRSWSCLGPSYRSARDGRQLPSLPTLAEAPVRPVHFRYILRHILRHRAFLGTNTATMGSRADGPPSLAA